MAELREWALYRHYQQEACERGLTALVAEHREGKVSNGKLLDTFDKGYLEAWLSHVYARQPVLKHFQGDHHRHKITRFQKLDLDLMGLARRKVIAQVSSRLPRGEGTGQSEIGVLRRELKKQKRHKAPRALFHEIRNLLPRLKPCVLISPLSVAQYLDPTLPPFDLVVFDEASQITPWDAAGVLRRAKQMHRGR